jgi:hypothetical protein
MKVLEIKNGDSVTIEDNIIFINCGFRSSNMVTFNSIEYISEVFNTEEQNKDKTDTEPTRKALGIDIDDKFRIRTSYEKVGTDPYGSNLTAIYIIYQKLKDGLLEWHRDKYNINKPRPPKVQ